jgi:hypothetical protein
VHLAVASRRVADVCTHFVGLPWRVLKARVHSADVCLPGRAARAISRGAAAQGGSARVPRAQASAHRGQGPALCGWRSRRMTLRTRIRGRRARPARRQASRSGIRVCLVSRRGSLRSLRARIERRQTLMALQAGAHLAAACTPSPKARAHSSEAGIPRDEGRWPRAEGLPHLGPWLSPWLHARRHDVHAGTLSSPAHADAAHAGGPFDDARAPPRPAYARPRPVCAPFYDACAPPPPACAPFYDACAPPPPACAPPTLRSPPPCNPSTHRASTSPASR